MDVFEINRILKDDKFAMIYRGEFNDELTFELMQIQSSGINEKKSVKKRLSYLIAECFQNIIRHSDNDLKEKNFQKSPILISRSVKGNHFITTANLIDNKNIERLTKTLNKLGELSQEEIESAFYEALNQNKISEKGGAGLGLIEMARKTKNAIAHSFVTATETHSYFIMQLQMKSEEAVEVEISIKENAHLFEEMTRNNVVLLRKGDFSQESILPIFTLFESNLALREEEILFKKKSLYVLIEMLQNINRHGLNHENEHEGIFVVTLNSDNSYKMETGNYITSENALSLQRDLDELAEMDRIQLNKRYKEQLLSESSDHGEGAGIGIIEMFRNSEGKINYSFQTISPGVSFFTIGVILN